MRIHHLAIAVRNMEEAAARYAGLLGRSLRNYYAAARAAGIWNEELSLADPEHLGYLPRSEVMAIATGSQGEPRAALQRLRREYLRHGRGAAPILHPHVGVPARSPRYHGG